MNHTLKRKRDIAIAELQDNLMIKTLNNNDYVTLIDGFVLSRRYITTLPDNCFYTPLISVTVQGFKRSIIGSEEYQYGEGHCLIAGVNIPSVNYVTVATKERPFLAATLFLDKQLITELIPELPPVQKMTNGNFRSILVTDADFYLLDAFLRLTNLIDSPAQIPVLAPMVIREIHYRLLLGPHSEMLRSLNTVGSQCYQVALAITWLRENYRDKLLVENLASKVNLAPSTFYRHFKQITTLSPLQYQKKLRLHEAKRIMLLEKIGAAEAGLAVGYESATQFNREYKRQFGESPHRNIIKQRKI